MNINKFLLFILLLICCIPVTSAEVINLTATDDAHVNQNYPDTNYGNVDNVNITGGFKYTGFIKFDVPEYTTKAYLHVYTDRWYKVTTVKDQDWFTVWRATSDWSEDTITYNNKPSYETGDEKLLDRQNVSANGQWVTLDVSDFVKHPTNYSFMLANRYLSQDSFVSKENTNESLRPYLEIHTGTPPIDIRYNNKTNNDTADFLVSTDDVIRFNISTPDLINITNYTWYVDKINTNNNISYFDFKVPAYNPSNLSTGIWEIRVEGNYSNGTNIVREWLISSLNESQAPDYIDYFVDQNTAYRTDYDKDPWGRPKPKYVFATNYAPRGFVENAVMDDCPTSYDINLKYGTYRVSMQQNLTMTITGYTEAGYPIYADLPQTAQMVMYDNTTKHNFGLTGTAADNHDYFSINNGDIAGYVPISKRWFGSAPGGRNWPREDTAWRDYTIVYTPDNYIYLYEKGVLAPRSAGYVSPNLLTNLSKITLLAGDKTIRNKMRLDSVEIYSNKYIFPDTNITYGRYSKYWHYLSSTIVTPRDDWGIIVTARNATLKQISYAINNESLITYNDITKTATLKTNLFLTAGSELNIKNETLLVDTNINSKFIRPEIASIIKIDNATITTTANNPLIWGFVNPYAQSIYDPVGSREWPSYGWAGGNPLLLSEMNWRGRLLINNSIIDNSCHMFLEGANEIILSNTVFSNMSASQFGENGYIGGAGNNDANQRAIATGAKSLRIVPTWELANFTVSNISFINPKSGITLEEFGGKWVLNDTTIKNSDLSNISISTSKSYKQETLPDFRHDDEPSHMALLNCKYNESNISVRTNVSILETKFYADIVVKDSLGNPIPNTIVSVTPSDVNYSAENLYERSGYFQSWPPVMEFPDGYFLTHTYDTEYGPGEGGASNYGAGYIDENGTLHGTMQNITSRGGYWFRWWNANNVSSIVTNSNGRTEFPNGYLNNSLVLADKVWSNNSGVLSNESLTYSLTFDTPITNAVTLDNINPYQGWYRSNITKPKYTIVNIVNNSAQAHLIGYAPAPEYNSYQYNDSLHLQVWPSESTISREWRVNGDIVSTTGLTYDMIIPSGLTNITFYGTTANGAISKTFLIDANSVPPISNFIANVTSGVYPLIVSFNDTSTGENIGSYEWDIDGDGKINSRSKNYTMTFKTPGKYKVIHTVSNSAGSNTKEVSEYITVIGNSPIKQAVHSIYGYIYNNFYNIFKPKV